MVISAKDLVRRRAGVEFSDELDGELLGVDHDRGLVHSLNPTAARIWALIERPATPETICTTLVREYPVEPETCRREVSGLLLALADRGLITVEPAARP